MIKSRVTLYGTCNTLFHFFAAWKLMTIHLPASFVMASFIKCSRGKGMSSVQHEH